MNEEKFLKFELINQTGDDGLPRPLLQIDIEKDVGGLEFKHEQRLFVDALNLYKFLTNKLNEPTN